MSTVHVLLGVVGRAVLAGALALVVLETTATLLGIVCMFGLCAASGFGAMWAAQLIRLGSPPELVQAKAQPFLIRAVIAVAILDVRIGQLYPPSLRAARARLFAAIGHRLPLVSIERFSEALHDTIARLRMGIKRFYGALLDNIGALLDNITRLCLGILGRLFSVHRRIVRFCVARRVKLWLARDVARDTWKFARDAWNELPSCAQLERDFEAEAERRRRRRTGTPVPLYEGLGQWFTISPPNRPSDPNEN